MTPDFSQLIARLTDAGFEFVVIGGYAAVTHGSSQVTRVLDVCAALTGKSVKILRSALAEWNPRPRLTPQRLSFLTFPPPGERLENIYLETDVGVVDILSSVLGVGDFERIKSKAEELEVDGRIVRVMALDDLIAAKEAMGRDKDRMNCESLKRSASVAAGSMTANATDTVGRHQSNPRKVERLDQAALDCSPSR